MGIFKWISDHRALIMLSIAMLGACTQYIYYKHLRKGLFKTSDLGYFWRLWKNEERDGKIMIYSTAAAILLSAALFISLITN